MISLWYAIKGLRHRRLRSWLTILGIAIGIMAIFSLISISLGIDKDVKEQIDSFGTRNIIVTAFTGDMTKASFGMVSGLSTISKAEYQTIKSLPYVSEVSRILYGKETIRYKKTSFMATVEAVDPSVFEQAPSSMSMEEGRRFYDGDKNVVILGHTIAHEYLDAKIGSNIIIGNKSFKIIGILNQLSKQESPDDSAVFIVYDDGLDLFSDMYKKGESVFLWVTIEEGYDVEQAGQNINDLLASLRKVDPDDPDFKVITPASLAETIGGVLAILSAFLGGVGFIAIVVGAIGIANTMFMSVIERRKEIGVLKALGMSNKDVLIIFIFESLLMSFVAGILGIGVSSLALYLARAFIPSVLSIELVVSVLALSLIIGAVAGYIPAKRTLEISPVEAMRYG